MYYGLVIISVIMFGIQFYVNDAYKNESGSGLASAMMLGILSGLTGTVFLFAMNGFSISATPFTVVMGAITAVNSVLYTVFALKALARINLSLYSLFAMLGGMLLPFFQGLFFYGEPFTLAKGLCLAFIAAALLLTVEKGDKKGGAIYYILVFVLNGMSGVLSKLYQELPFEKSSNADYSLWIAIISTVISSAVLFYLLTATPTDAPRFTVKSAIFGTVNGGLSRVANYILLIALTFLPASIQYPFITGGVMIVSTAICFITGQKPSKKEVISVVLAFIGVLLLVCVPV